MLVVNRGTGKVGRGRLEGERWKEKVGRRMLEGEGWMEWGIDIEVSNYCILYCMYIVNGQLV